MFSIKNKTAVAIILTLSLVPVTLGQQPQATTPAATAPAPRGPDYVDFTGFKGRVFDVKYRDPRALMQALYPLGSGFKGASIMYSDEFKTLTVRDFPENIAAIEEALKRLDVQQAAQPDIELRMNVLLATNVEGATSQYPGDVGDVVKQLQTTLSYKSYYNIATIVQRAKDGTHDLYGKGVAEVAAQIMGVAQPINANYSFNIQSLMLTPESPGALTVQLRGTAFDLSGPSALGQASIRTSLSVRSGEKVVVGTATVGKQGLILVLSAKVAK